MDNNKHLLCDCILVIKKFNFLFYTKHTILYYSILNKVLVYNKYSWIPAAYTITVSNT